MTNSDEILLENFSYNGLQNTLYADGRVLCRGIPEGKTINLEDWVVTLQCEHLAMVLMVHPEDLEPRHGVMWGKLEPKDLAKAKRFYALREQLFKLFD